MFGNLYSLWKKLGNLIKNLFPLDFWTWSMQGDKKTIESLVVSINVQLFRLEFSEMTEGQVFPKDFNLRSMTDAKMSFVM